VLIKDSAVVARSVKTGMRKRLLNTQQKLLQAWNGCPKQIQPTPPTDVQVHDSAYRNTTAQVRRTVQYLR
jgi:hypothetical protein